MTKYIGRTGPVILSILAIIPLFWWWSHANFSTFSRASLALGQATALIGYCLYCLNFVISARLKVIEPVFAGLPRAYIWHHLTGATAFVLILYHPLLITLSYASISLPAAVNLLWPDVQNLPVYLGIIALLLMILLLVLTLFVKLEYDFWKKTHQYLGLAFILASLHVFLIGSTLALSPALKVYLLVLAGAALVSYTYRTLLNQWLVPKKAYIVTGIKNLTRDVLEISITPGLGGGIDYAAGQFIYILPSSRGVAHQSHPFSLTCAEGETTLTVGVKALGDFTETLKLLKPGVPVLVEGAFGRFSYKFYPYKKQIWIAGGIGVTPFVSLAKSLEMHEGFSVDFYYSVKDTEEAVYRDIFEQIAAINPEFKFHLHLSAKKGRLTVETIAGDVKDFSDREIFVCGPTALMVAMKKQLHIKKVKNSHIHTEEFSLPTF